MSIEESTEMIPLCVDLDDSLLKTDLLFEALSKALSTDPLVAFEALSLLFKNKAKAKTYLADNIDLETSLLPLNKDIADFLKEESSRRDVYLVTASPEKWAKQIAAEVGIFKDVFASNDAVNLKGEHKEEFLNKKFGKENYDYLGDSRSDLKVWRSSRKAYVVGSSSKLKRAVERCSKLEGEFGGAGRNPLVIAKALRVYQWIKNILIFVPVVAAHQISSPATVFQGGIAFLSFSLAASSVYLLNDICDLESDRAHRSKCKRPIPAGDLKILDALVGIPILLTLSFGLTFFLNPGFFAVLLAYLCMTTLYSFSLKRRAMVDVVVLASLYTVRMVAGATATQIPVSLWLFSFSMFFFFSLACAKRYAELYSKEDTAGQVPGRGYLYTDRDLVGLLGVSSSMTSILVLALYVTAQEVVSLYAFPAALLLLCPLVLLWISKIWLAAYRGELDDDPIVFALRYRGSYIIGFAAALILYVATKDFTVFL